MRLAVALYLVALLLITLFTDVIFGINAQSLAYGPVTLALLVLLYLALTDGPHDFIARWYTSSPMLPAGLLFLAGLAASMPNAHDLALAVRDAARWSFVWLVYAPVTRALGDSPRRCRLLARATAAFIILFAVLAVGDLLAGGAITRTLIGRAGVSGEGRYLSLYGNAGIFAGMLIVGFPLALLPALSATDRVRQIGWAAGTAVIIVGILLSGSRAAVAAAFVATVTVAVAQRRWWLLGLATACGLAIVVLASAHALHGPPALERIQQLAAHSGPGMRSFRRRAFIWAVAAELIEHRPLVGWGGAQLRFHQHGGFNRAHNAWLDAWLDGGLPAALAMLIVTWHVVRRAWATLTHQRRRYLAPTHVALVASCLAVHTGWMVRAGIGSRIDWLPIFMLFALWWERGASHEAESRPEQESGELAAPTRPVGKRSFRHPCGTDSLEVQD